MKLFDPADRSAIETGLKRVFGWFDDGKKINLAIAAQVTSIHTVCLQSILSKICIRWYRPAAALGPSTADAIFAEHNTR